MCVLRAGLTRGGDGAKVHTRAPGSIPSFCELNSQHAAWSLPVAALLVPHPPWCALAWVQVVVAWVAHIDDTPTCGFRRRLHHGQLKSGATRQSSPFTQAPPFLRLFSPCHRIRWAADVAVRTASTHGGGESARKSARTAPEGRTIRRDDTEATGACNHEQMGRAIGPWVGGWPLQWSASQATGHALTEGLVRTLGPR